MVSRADLRMPLLKSSTRLISMRHARNRIIVDESMIGLLVAISSRISIQSTESKTIFKKEIKFYKPEMEAM